jgi:hypothetical protein
MSFRSKLTIGLGFLFLIIFGLAIYSSFDIQALSKYADRILKDNYDSLVYCRNMLLVLDDMRISSSDTMIGQSPSGLLTASKSIFEKNLAAENGNITEVHEGEYVEELNKDYSLFRAYCLQGRAGRSSSYRTDFLQAYLNARQAIVKINDVNMEAIERKNLATKKESSRMIEAIAAVGAGSVVLAFFYFWFFPAYVSSTLSYLENRMRGLLEGIQIRLDTQSKDEAFVLLRSITLLEKRLLGDRN